jgi:hypothetical protein
MSTGRPSLADLPEDVRTRLEAMRAYRHTPEGLAELERIRAAVRQDYPPLPPDPDLVNALGALRAERERQRISLLDLAERTKMDASFLSKLESGAIPNPSIRSDAWSLTRRRDQEIGIPANGPASNRQQGST